MLKVLLTKRAEDSLSEIIDYYLARYSPERAAKVVESIDEAFVRISHKPLNYPVCFDVTHPVENTRQIIVHHTFKIVYRINKDTIDVLEIFNGKRNPGLLRDVDE
jgi:plasmid stabilization system protein ParE